MSRKGPYYVNLVSIPNCALAFFFFWSDTLNDDCLRVCFFFHLYKGFLGQEYESASSDSVVFVLLVSKYQSTDILVCFI